MADVASLVIRVQALEADLAARRLRDLSRAGREAEGSMSKMSGAAKAVGSALAAMGVATVAKEILQAADAYQNMTAKLTLVTGSTEGATQAYDKLLGLVRGSHADLASTGDLFIKLSNSTKALGLDQAQLLTITDTVGKSLRVGGSSAQESEAAIRQLAQAFGSGALKGDEFNSIMENGTRIAQALADQMTNGNIGALKKMAGEGQLTSAAMAKAFIDQSQKINAEFKTMPETVSTVMQDIKNEINDAFGKTNTGPLVDSMKEFREILKDPNVKKNLEELGGAMATLAGWAVKGAAAFAEFGDGLGYAAAKMAGNASQQDQLIKNIDNIKQSLSGDWFHQGSGKNFFKTTDEMKTELAGLEKQLADMNAAQNFVEQKKVDAPAVTSENIVLGDPAADKKHADGIKKIEERIAALKLEGETAGMTAKQAELYKLAQDGATSSQLAAVESAYSLIDAQEAQKKSLEDRKAIDDYLKDLKDQDATLGMNVISLERYKLAQMGATEQDIQAAIALKNKNVAFQLERELMTEQERALQEYADKKALIEQSTTGAQKDDLLGRLSRGTNDKLSDFGQETGSPSIDDKMAELQAEYDARYQVVMENETLIETDRQELLANMQQGYMERMRQFEAVKQQQQFESAAAMFDGLAGLAKTFGGEQSKSYKVLFAASKAFSIAQATMSMFTGIGKGVELGFPAMIPAIAMAAAQGAQAISGVKSQNFAGAFDEGGNIPAGSVGLVGEIGPELISGPANVTSRKDTAAMMGGKSEVKVAVFNLWNASMIESLKSSDEFDEVIVNSISRNQQATKQAMG